MPLADGDGVRDLLSGLQNVSSRKLTPMPSVPPTSFSVVRIHGWPLTISATAPGATEITLPFARPEATDLINAF